MMTAQADRRTAEKMAKWLRAHGYVLSAQMLEHYLSGVGGTVRIPLASLRSSFFFQDAEKRLLSRVNEAVLRQAVAMLREGDDQRMVDHIDHPGNFLNDCSAAIEPFTPTTPPICTERSDRRTSAPIRKSWSRGSVRGFMPLVRRLWSFVMPMISILRNPRWSTILASHLSSEIFPASFWAT